MSGHTRREVERARRVVARWKDQMNLESDHRRDERLARIIATEFGAIRRGMILSLKNEIDRQAAKMPLALETRK